MYIFSLTRINFEMNILITEVSASTKFLAYKEKPEMRDIILSLGCTSHSYPTTIQFINLVVQSDLGDTQIFSTQVSFVLSCFRRIIKFQTANTCSSYLVLLRRIIFYIILIQLYIQMYNLPSKGHKRHQNSLIFLLLLALIILLGVLCLLGGFSKSKVLSAIASDEVVMKKSRLLKEQDQIQEQIKIKTSDLQSVLKRQVFNLANQDKIFGQEEKFGVRVDAEDFKRNSDYQLYKSNGIFDRIQVSTPYDYANLTRKVNFEEVSKNMMASVSYELIEFQQTQQAEKLGQLTMETLVKDKKEHASIMKMSNMTDQQLLKRAQYNLAIRLNEDPNSVLLKEAEYLMYDIKYNLSSIAEQLPICIYASGYNLFLKNNYSQFFESINRFNYTNYHIVYADDNSSPGNIEGILQFLQKGNFRFKNKIKVINNKQHLGSLGNLYIWINKYCNEGDIVIHPDADDWFIGSQVLKVVNAAYQNPQIWYAYSKYLRQTGKNNYTNGQSKALQIPVAQYRNTKNWSASHLRTFRKKLFSKIPLSYFIQYHLDEATSMAYPTFMKIAADTAQIYSQLQLCGDKRYKHITDYLYLYAGPGTKTFNSKGVNCFRLHEIKDAQKTKIKIPFKMLNSIYQPAQSVQNFVPLQETLDLLGNNYRGYNECLEDLQKQAVVAQEQNSKNITVDTMKKDSIKVDTTKANNIRVDTMAMKAVKMKTDTTKTGIIKLDATKAGIKVDAIKASIIKVDAIKANATKIDATKANATKIDNVEIDIDNVKVDTIKNNKP